MTLAIVVGCAGALGAIARYLVDGAVDDGRRGVVRFGTLTVNVVGSFVLGVVTGVALAHDVDPSVRTIVGVGFCGGLTTWSAAAWETVRLLEEGRYAAGLAHAIGGLAASLAAAALGLALGQAP